MYCSYCGQEIDDKAAVCVHCGRSVKAASSPEKTDGSSAGLAVLGFFIPIVGLILYLVMEKDQPLRAKSAGKGALIGFITDCVVSLVSAIVSAISAGAMFSSIFAMLLEMMGR